MENKNRFYSNSYVVKELETYKKTKGVENVFKILKESSLDLFEASLEAYDYKSCNIKLIGDLYAKKFDELHGYVDTNIFTNASAPEDSNLKELDILLKHPHTSFLHRKKLYE